ncbi:DUF1801 domain-containing protein [Microbacterium jejuense]|uniref:DUF1801 domain-containing protein n=1 Tax=Microbacterium jejuense TaxID=1263637 RepID=A0ABS7HSQ4_9MICO|nr:DUF1801 domain-containing protein [Microbacterium jejuense]MBW9095064.1 DUF1801 domain-containing protein [Microbacterium jejuense]
MAAAEVEEFLAGVTPAVRQRDALTLVELMRRATGEEPVLQHPGIVAFGRYHYEYASGRSGDAAAAGFAPRKTATVVYLSDGTAAHADALSRLGPHTSGVGCLYLKRLDDIDLTVLEAVVRRSYETLTAGTFGTRAPEASAG